MFFLEQISYPMAEQITDIKFLDTSSDPAVLELVSKGRLKTIQQNG